MSAAPIEDRRSTAERAHAAILAEIIDGSLAPGEMLSEVALAARLGVSRTPIRTALTRLQDDGWITVYPKRGALVLGLSDRDIADLADARLVLESSAIARSDAAGRQRLADTLAPLIDLQEEAFRTADIARFIELTLEFHGSFVAASDNRVLIDLSDRLADRQRQLLHASRDILTERSESIIEEHRVLVERLRADDVAGFTAALHHHITATHGDPLGPA